jgi:hypothetical protein
VAHDTKNEQEISGIEAIIPFISMQKAAAANLPPYPVSGLPLAASVV